MVIPLRIKTKKETHCIKEILKQLNDEDDMLNLRRK